MGGKRPKVRERNKAKRAREKREKTTDSNPNIFGSNLRKLDGTVHGSRSKNQFAEEGLSWILSIITLLIP